MTLKGEKKRIFNILMFLSFVIYTLVLILSIMLKVFMVEDVCVSYNFLSNFTLEERFIRGINLLEFYTIEYELGIIKRTIILDLLNCLIFVPFGIFVAHFIKKQKILKTLLITLFVSIFIELFQLITIIGSFMLNDLITNVIGGIIGSILYILIIKSKKYNVYNILLSIFLIASLILFSYLSFELIDNVEVYRKLLKI